MVAVAEALSAATRSYWKLSPKIMPVVLAVWVSEFAPRILVNLPLIGERTRPAGGVRRLAEYFVSPAFSAPSGAGENGWVMGLAGHQTQPASGRRSCSQRLRWLKTSPATMAYTNRAAALHQIG